MNVAYINLSYRMFGEGGEYEDQQEPAEVYMRRKELLDDIHRVIDIVEPGLTRRRGTFFSSPISLSVLLWPIFLWWCRSFTL